MEFIDLGGPFPSPPLEKFPHIFTHAIDNHTDKGGAAGDPRRPISTPTLHPSLCEDGEEAVTGPFSCVISTSR
jgi:hypothetical protein